MKVSIVFVLTVVAVMVSSIQSAALPDAKDALVSRLINTLETRHVMKELADLLETELEKKGNGYEENEVESKRMTVTCASRADCNANFMLQCYPDNENQCSGNDECKCGPSAWFMFGR